MNSDDLEKKKTKSLPARDSKLDPEETIVVVGMACRFPGATDYDTFWNNLAESICSIEEIPSDRWDAETFYSPDFNAPNKSVSRWIGLVHDEADFDNRFFNISPREARNMDPQQRLLLEETWHCMEDAGLPLSVLRRDPTDVYVGVMGRDHLQESSIKTAPTDSYAALGAYDCILANRLSYFLGLNGTSLSIDAACASSLVALHKARLVLKSNSCRFAFVAGVSLNLHPFKYISFSKSRMLSPDGLCKTFDQSANGYVPGDGIGVLLLCKLADALKEGCTIHGIIAGSSVNHVGRAVSLTAPSIEAQRNVIMNAYQQAGLSPDTTTYTEAHGTGTSLGDPIEVEALTKAFRSSSKGKNFCGIGSVKTNIGHLEASAGVAGVIKVLMMMKHRQIPKTLHIETLNPLIRFHDSPFNVALDKSPWLPRRKNLPLRAGVSSFGFGGVNSHTIIQEYKPVKSRKKRKSAANQLFLLSAKSQSALIGLVKKWQDFMADPGADDLNFADLCKTTTCGRESQIFRIGAELEDAQALRAWLAQIDCDVTKVKARPLCLQVAPLPQAQLPQVLASFLRYPLFKWHLEQTLAALPDKKLKVLLKGKLAENLKACGFVLSCALIDALAELDITADLVLPHGEGLYVALATSGVLSRSDALGLLMGTLSEGEIHLERPKLPFFNGVSNSIIWPKEFSRAYLEELLKKQKISDEDVSYFTQKGKLLMENQFTFKKYMQEWDKALNAYDLTLHDLMAGNQTHLQATTSDLLLSLIITSCLERLNKKWQLEPETRSLQGAFCEMRSLIADEWLDKDEVITLLTTDSPYLEALAQHLNLNRLKHKLPEGLTILDRHNKALKSVGDVVDWARQMRDTPEVEIPSEYYQQSTSADTQRDFVGDLLLRFWLQGEVPQWDRLWPSGSFQRLSLPTYVFDSFHFKLPQHEDATLIPAAVPVKQPEEPLKIQEEEKKEPMTKSKLLRDPENPNLFSRVVNSDDVIIKDTVVLDRFIVPSTLRLEMALESSRLVTGKPIDTYKKLMFMNAGVVNGDYLIKTEIDAEASRFTVSWERNSLCQGEFAAVGGPAENRPELATPPNVAATPGEEVYRHYVSWGYQYGPTLNLIQKVWETEEAFIFHLEVVPIEEGEHTGLDPHLLDCVFQSVFWAANATDDRLLKDGNLYVPFTVDSLQIFGNYNQSGYIVIRKDEFQVLANLDISLNFRAYDEAGGEHIRIEKMVFKRANVNFVDPTAARRLKPLEDGNPQLPLETVSAPMEADLHARQEHLLHLEDSMVKVENYGHYLLLKTLQENGHLTKPGERFSRDEFKGALNLIPKYERLYGALLEMLPRVGFLSEDGDTFTVTDKVTEQATLDQIKALESTKDEVSKACEDMTPFLNLLTVAITNYPAILKGDKTHLEVLFPKGSGALFERIYKENALSDHYNALVTRAILSFLEAVRKAQPDHTVRILEIGSGTGGTSAGVMKALSPYGDHIEYYYTDISLGFTNFGKRTWGKQYPFARFKPLDIEKDPMKQGFEFKGYDLIFETNCIHATRDLDITTVNMKKLLRSNGLLIINEISRLQDFWTFVAGLIDGWWLFTDTGRIPHSPLLSHLGWRELFERHGFYNAYGPDGERVKPYEQAVVLAFSDGRAKEDKPADAAKSATRTGSSAVGGAVGAVCEGLKTIFADVLQMEVSEIENDGEFVEYGIDSMVSLEILNQLDEIYGELPKSLMFEYLSIKALSEYLLKEHADICAKTFPAPEEEAPTVDEAAPEAPSAPAAPSEVAVSPAQPVQSLSREMAVVGLAGRYPDAGDIRQLWQNLVDGKHSITEVPQERWDWKAYYHEEKGRSGKAYTQWGGFLDDYDKFDPLFFKIAPKAAELMDPQQRIFLETAWAALEDAGYTPKSLSDDVGVFVGVTTNTYGFHGVQQTMMGNPQTPDVDCYDIANRVSYHFNFNGPSMAIDSACSSSLTALHLAVESIARGESVEAIAGGVSLTLHPSRILQFCSKTMLSPGDRARTFGQGADGFVDAEGVGAVLIKPLAAAEATGDHIYAVIKGSAVNAGGRTSGYTVPNPNAQGKLVAKAMERANVEPQTVGYIEAHGTGTSLGDPIEIAGLKQAFGPDVPADSCRVGSIKTNIGHTIAAAGIAGFTKTLLQLQHRTLVPSLHAETTNDFIDFSTTPFQVQTALEPWARKSEGTPLRAGISSFGAGGANAHIILEEYTNQPIPPDDGQLELVLLSAKTPTGLTRNVTQLLDFVTLSIRNDALRRDGNQSPTLGEPVTLRDLAFTLRVGRESMPVRLAILVKNKDELILRLKDFLESRDHSDMLAVDLSERKGLKFTILDDEDGRAYIDALIRKGKPRQLASLWTQGIDVEWSAMRRAGARRISLPTYAFARERYWIKSIDGPVTAASQTTAQCHPLVHRNTSTLAQQRFTSDFQPGNVFFRDHVVNQRQVFPGGACLEMARAAGALATETAIHQISGSWWTKPIIGDGHQVEAHISIEPSDDGLKYQLYTGNGDIHGEGWLGIHPVPEPQPRQLQDVRNRCQTSLDTSAIYAGFARGGISYGPAFQTLQSLRLSSEEAIGQLSLPLAAGSVNDFGLHPCLIDGALQTAVQLMYHRQGAASPMMILGLEELLIHGPLEANLHAHAVLHPEHVGGSNDFRKCDVYLTNQEGKVLVSLLGFTARGDGGSQEDSDKTVFLEETWQASQGSYQQANPKPNGSLMLLANKALSQSVAARWPDTELVFVEEGETFKSLPNQGHGLSFSVQPDSQESWLQLAQVLKEKGVVVSNIINLWSMECETNLRRDLVLAPVTSLAMLQALRPLYGADLRLLFVHPLTNGEVRPGLAALRGLARTLQLEHPQTFIKTLALQPSLLDEPLWMDQLVLELHPQNAAFAVRMDQTGRQVCQRREFTPEPVQGDGVTLRQGGVYLLTGGMGGIGSHFAKHLAGKYGARLVIAGRRAQDEHITRKLQELDQLGGQTAYFQAHLGHRDDVNRLIAQTQERFGALNGIIHAAGVNIDSFFFKKTSEEMHEVFAPKIWGTVNLDEASANLPLDFMMVFSSLAALIGNAGQCDYAYANSFIDHFARKRNSLVAQGHRHGKSLAINWPLWQDGGMNIESHTLDMFRREWGMTAMPAEQGLKVFEDGLARSRNRFAVVHGSRAGILNGFEDKRSVAREEIQTEVPIEVTDIAGKTRKFLLDMLAKETGMDTTRIKPHLSFEAYGIDSVMVLNLNRKLESQFGALSKTLLFEFDTIDSLADYLQNNHREQLQTRFAGTAETLSAKEVQPRAPKKSEAPKRAAYTGPNRFARKQQGGEKPRALSVRPAPVAQIQPMPRPAKTPQRPATDKVAIVGLSGRFPMAPDLDTFWENLKEGKDCISEIPADRWNYEDYFHPDKNNPGTSYSKWGGFLDDVDKFDARFFNISPREAQITDPQERLFLETVWHTLEDAGYTRSAFSGRDVGVFVGVMWGEYQLFGAEQTLLGQPIAASSSYASIANRVSYWFDFRGPSMALDTMCSSSLSAIHLACESLRTGESVAAVAGGVNLSVHPNKYLYLSQGKFAAMDGRCKGFGEGGDGYVPGEGVGAVLLKPYANAVADGDHIHGVILATALNHGGKTHGYTVPSPNAQGELIGKAINRAGIHPQSLGYIEAHGTGTSLGDPIEITGLNRALAPYKLPIASLPVGTVKSNVGHLESAAGIAGVAKILLQMKHQQLVPSIHTQILNPNIDFSTSPMRVQRELSDWAEPADGDMRRAGISSFGAGGSNSHLIIEEHRAVANRQITKGAFIVPISARTEAQIAQVANTLAQFIQAQISAGTSPDTRPIEQNLQQYAGQILNVPASEVSCNEPLGDLGFDAHALKLLEELIDQDQALDLDLDLDLSALATMIAQDSSVDQDALPLQDLAFTTQLGREALKYRLALIVDNVQALQQQLAAFAEGSRDQMIWGVADETSDAKVVASVDLERVAQQWVEGGTVNWEAYHQESRRIPLPVYPFERKSYWLEQQATGVVAKVSDVHTFQRQWRDASVDSAMQDPARVLVLSEKEQPADLLSDIEHVQVKPSTLAGYQQLFEQHQPSHILFMLPSESTSLDQQLANGFQRIVDLCQSWLQHTDARLKIVAVHNGEHPAYSALAAAFRTIGAEAPNLDLRLLECDAPTGPILRAELLDERPAAHVRILDGRRQLPAWHTNPAMPAKPLQLVDDAVYLIVGGLGGLGTIVAQHLLDKNPSVRLVLAGRSELKGEKATALQSLGERAHYLRADLSNQESMTQLVAHINREWGTIRGVVHAAGIQRDSFIQNKTQEQMDTVLAPKFWGTVYLEEATRTQPLDFFVTFSSMAALLANPGQSDYAFANAFQDAYCAQRNQSNAPGYTISINWPLWRDGGMQLDETGQQMIASRYGMMPLATKAGLQALDAALTSHQDQWVVAQGDADKLLASLDLKPTLKPATESQVTNAAPQLQDDLSEMVRQVLKMDDEVIEMDADLSDFGFDSISFTELASLINRRYDLSLAATIFFEYPNLAALTDYLTQNITISQSPTPVTPESPRNEPIAIVGMAAHMPGARDVDAFWKRLADGTDLMQEIPARRWDWRSWYGDPESSENLTNIKHGAFIDDEDLFDPTHFGISPTEALLMDPQQRLFLQLTWKTIEEAGYAPQELAGTRCGLYIGIGTSDYHELLAGQEIAPHWLTGKAHSILPNRISYLLNLRGPSEPIDTACSSSLVAVDRAVKALRAGDCETAIAGGINLMLNPETYVAISKAGMLSDDGRCKTFDHRANGYARGEGAGALLLKPLSKAEADGDHIHALVMGSAVNHGGKAPSLTAPNTNAQAEVICEAWQVAGVSPLSAGYLEAHGTGTSLGDPIEVNGMKKAFGELYQNWDLPKSQQAHCGIGSVKTNIGHLEVAAGVAGLLKLILSLKHQQRPASLHLQQQNPRFDLKDSPFRIVTQTEDWPAPDGALRCGGVSSFGFGGVNAHVVLQEYLYDLKPAAVDRVLIPISGRTPELLQEQVRALHNWLGLNDPDLIDLSFTLQVGRNSLEFRLALVVNDHAELKQQLQAFLQGESVGWQGQRIAKARQTHLSPQPIQFGNAHALAELAKAWVDGTRVDWSTLYANKNPRRLSLPTYVFARERYWLAPVPTPELRKGTTSSHLPFSVITYQPQQVLDLFHVDDHKVGDNAVLPAVAYLEMVRSAASVCQTEPVRELRDITWTAALILDHKAQSVSISFETAQEGLRFTVHSQREGQNLEHASGRVITGQTQDGGTHHALKTDDFTISWRGQECYARLRAMGLNYGPHYRALQQLQSNTREAVAHLSLAQSHSHFLDPSLMDGALQSPLGLLSEQEAQAGTAWIPYSLDRLIIHSAVNSSCVAHARKHGSSLEDGHFDIQLQTQDGKILVSLQGLRYRATLLGTSQVQPEAYFFEPQWLDHTVATGGQPFKGTVLVPSMEEPLEIVAQKILEQCTAFGEGQGLELAVVVPSRLEPAVFALDALLRTLSAERPQWKVRLLAMDKHQGHNLSSVFQGEGYQFLRFANQSWQLRHLVKQTTQDATMPLKADGVYVIVGGNGGLGRLLANHLQATHNAKVALIGRSSRASGQHLYLKADCADASSMSAALDDVKQQLGAIDGVFHCAGVQQDAALENIDHRTLEAVCLSKVRGTDVLVGQTQSHGIPLLVLFSSGASLVGNPGQAAYAMANGYMDGVAQLSQTQSRILAINWPYWEEGGMTTEPLRIEVNFRRTGIASLSTATGMKSLDHLLASNAVQSMPLPGDPTRINQFLGLERSNPQPEIPTDQSTLVDYLADVIGSITQTKASQMDATRPLEEYGVDSFLTLKVIKTLEKDFGRLTKTLLFDHDTLEALAQYFHKERAEQVEKLLGKTQVTKAQSVATIPAAPQHVMPVQGEMILEAELTEHHPHKATVQTLFERYRSEGSVSRGTRNIAPYLYLGSARKGYFNFHHTSDMALVYAYSGPQDYLKPLYKEMSDFCKQKGWQLNMLTEEPAFAVDGLNLCAHPFGAVQRVHDLSQFSLDGRKMRRLRYLVNKFQKQGSCITQEFRAGSDARITQEILRVCDQWCAEKTKVNPLIASVRDEIANGSLSKNHRIFVTYLNDILQNAIVISSLADNKGYLMDLEFYPPEMPLGGLEFAICEIIKLLAAEGCQLLSLGGTFGPVIGDLGRLDAKVWAELEKIRDQGIFEGAGNFQFKNKFNPQNTPVYLIREEGANPATVIDVIMAIADPEAVATPTPVVPAGKHDALLQSCHFNPMLLDNAQVPYDLNTDSWAQLDFPELQQRMAQLQQAAMSSQQQDPDPQLFGFPHQLLLGSGRMAERLLCSTLPKGATIIQNLLFPTWIYHQMDRELKPIEMPHPGVNQLNSAELFRGNLDTDRLAHRLSSRANEVALICVELSNNAAGGYPVSLANLKQVAGLARQHSIKLCLDATRILENARFIIAHEPGFQGHDLWRVARELCDCADMITVSLAKDFGLARGGLIGVRDAALFHELQEAVAASGSGLNLLDRKIITQALSDRSGVAALVNQRMANVASLHQRLIAVGAPVASPVGSHCILLNVNKLQRFRDRQYGVQECINWIFSHTGIRIGRHNAGMQQNTELTHQLRIAIPLGLSVASLNEIATRLEHLFRQQPEAMGLELIEKGRGAMAWSKARYRSLVSLSSETIQPQGQKQPVAQAPTQHEDIAIVGMSGRYAAATDLDQFWQHLAQGSDLVGPMPQQRRKDFPAYDAEDFEAPEGYLPRVDHFDAPFFQIPDQEARDMDPQERIMLEVAWEAIEDSGFSPQSLGGPQHKVGVYVGAVWSLYQMLGAEQQRQGQKLGPNSFQWSLSNRISHSFDFQGPSFTVDAACSASLTALYLACRALQRGECASALVGGVNLALHPYKRRLNMEGDLVSKSGRCRPFSEAADGYVTGEGAGAVVLKPLSLAKRDGSRILAVIKGIEVNHDGASSGFTVPNPELQTRLITETLERAEIDAQSIDYIETHGTGTAMGDAIEMEALTLAFESAGIEKGRCPIGSVKSNIGHLEAASGMASLAKLILQMQHGQLVPTIHSGTLSPFIDFPNTPFTPVTESRSWPVTQGRPKRAALNCFGAGGANVHLIVEAAPQGTAPSTSGPEVLLFSAKDDARLDALIDRYIAFLEQPPHDLSLRSMAATLQLGRVHHSHRLALVCGSLAEVRTSLQAARRQQAFGGFRGQATGEEPWTGSSALKDQAAAWVTGATVDWVALNAGKSTQRAALPTYAFNPLRYWLDEEVQAPAPVQNHVDKTKGPARDLQEQIADMKGVSPQEIPLDETFPQMDIDSLGQMKLLTYLRGKYGNIPLRALLKNNTVDKLSAYLCAQKGIMVEAEENQDSLVAILQDLKNGSITPEKAVERKQALGDLAES